MWRSLLAWLASLTADPVAVDREAPKATAAVAAAYATFATGTAAPQPDPKPTPRPDQKCQSCGGRGYIVHGDGHRTDCPQCETLERMNCPDGKCPLPKTVLR